jgi:hypothetical protein
MNTSLLRNGLIVVLGLAGLLIAWHQLSGVQSPARSWQPVLTEAFTPGWEGRWRIDEGTVEVQAGALLTTAPGATVIRCRQRLEAPFAVEYTASSTIGSALGDLSLVLWRDPGLTADGAISDPGSRILVQLGAYEGSYSAVIHADATRYEHCTAAPFRPEPGRSYRVRVEVAGQDLTVAVDGTEILHHVDAITIQGAQVGLQGYYPGKHFSAVRLLQREDPATISPAAVGDAFLAAGDARRAILAYERAMRAAQGDLRAELNYKRGLAFIADGKLLEARGSFLNVVDEHGRWGRLARLAAMDAWAAEPEILKVHPSAERIWREGGSAQRNDFEQAWVRWIYRAAQADVRPAVDGWLAFRERLFPDSYATQHAAAAALSMTGRPAEVVERFPGQYRMVALSLIQLGRPEEVLTRAPDQRGTCAEALLAMGRGSEIAQRYPEQQRWIEMARLHAGEAAALRTGTGYAAERAALYLGGPDAADLPPTGRVRAWADGFAGRHAAVLANREADHGDRLASGATAAPPVWLAWRALLADPAAARAAITADLARSDLRLAKARWLLLPALDRAAALPAEAPALVLNGRPRHWSACLAGSDDGQGAADARFDRADRALCLAVRADRAGQPAVAAGFYAEWLAIPAWQRDEQPDPVAEAVVTARHAACLTP